MRLQLKQKCAFLFPPDALFELTFHYWEPYLNEGLSNRKWKKDQILGPFFLIAQPLYSSFNDQQQKIITKNNYVLQKQTQFKDKFNIHNQLIMCQ